MLPIKSTHHTEVIQVFLEPHPNADQLSIVRVGGYQVCVRTDDWKNGDLGAYVVPDSIVDTGCPEFAFLGDGEPKRIRIKKLRGVLSMGLLVPAPANALLGDNVSEQLGVTRYEPPLLFKIGDNVAAPNILTTKYDIDTVRRYPDIFATNELVSVTEKIHGANGRFVYHDGEQYCGSRTLWKKEEPNSIWWRALRNSPELESYCMYHRDMIVYGEVYGRVQELRYGLDKDVAVAVFDILKGGQWLDVGTFWRHAAMWKLPTVPMVADPVPFDLAIFEDKYANGPSLIKGADNIREGCVIKPLKERTHVEIGRVILKLVGSDYLTK